MKTARQSAGRHGCEMAPSPRTVIPACFPSFPRNRMCQNTTPARRRPPNRHSRESGNPGGVERGKRRCSTLPPILDSRLPGRVQTPLPLGEGGRRPGEGAPTTLSAHCLPHPTGCLHRIPSPQPSPRARGGSFDTACFAGMTQFRPPPSSTGRCFASGRAGSRRVPAAKSR